MNIGIIAQHADIRQWLESHAEEVARVQPSWASPSRTWVDLDFEGENAASVRFDGYVGRVEVSQCADVNDDTLTLRREPKIGDISDGTVDSLTLTELRRLADISKVSVSEMYESLVASRQATE